MSSLSHASPPTVASPDNPSSTSASLLEKYASIEIEITQTQDETAVARREIAQAQEETEAVREGTIALQEQLQTEAERKEKISEELQITKQKLDLVCQTDREAAKQALQEAEGHLEWIIETDRTQRQDFLRTAREFRASCKKKCSEAGFSDLSHSVLKTYVNAKLKNFDHDESDERGREGGDDNLVAKQDLTFAKILEDATTYFEAKDKEQALELDSEFEKVKEEQEEQENLLKEANAVLEELRPKHDAAKKQYKEEEERREQLKSQRERIQKDIDDLQARIEGLKEQTEEANQLSATYQKETKRRRLGEMRKRRGNNAVTSPLASAAAAAAVTPSPSGGKDNLPLPHQQYNNNPYMRYAKKQKDQSQKNQNDNGQMQGQKQAPIKERSANDQYPHHAGRARAFRQFGSPLGIHNALSLFPGVPETAMQPASPEVRVSTDSSGYQTPKPRKRSVIADSSDEEEMKSPVEEDSDSDSDAELLSFTGLRKKN